MRTSLTSVYLFNAVNHAAMTNINRNSFRFDNSTLKTKNRARVIATKFNIAFISVLF